MNIITLLKRLRIRRKLPGDTRAVSGIIMSFVLSSCVITSSHVTAKAESTVHTIPTLYYAGFGYLGRFDNISQKYPQAVRLNKPSKGALSTFNQAFINGVKAQRFANFNLSFELVDQHKNRPVMLALALERESLAHNYLNDPITEATGQLIVFDYDTMTYLNSVHIPLSSNGKADIDVPDTLFEKMYLDEPGFVKTAIQELTDLQIQEPAGVRFGVTTVRYQNEGNITLPESVMPIVLEEFIGQFFSSKLSQAGLNVIPHVRGATLGNQMVLRMADTSAYNVSLPLPDYAIEVTVLALDKFSDQQFDYYGVNLLVDVKLLATGESILNLSLINVEHNPVNNRAALKDMWAPVEDSIESLLKGLSKEFISPTRAWCDEHCEDPKDIRLLNAFNQKIKKFI